jgi:hypothetical protein
MRWARVLVSGYFVVALWSGATGGGLHPMHGAVSTVAACPYAKRHPRLWVHLVGSVDAADRCVRAEHRERVVGARRTQVRQLSLLPACVAGIWRGVPRAEAS